MYLSPIEAMRSQIKLGLNAPPYYLAAKVDGGVAHDNSRFIHAVFEDF